MSEDLDVSRLLAEQLDRLLSENVTRLTLNDIEAGKGTPEFWRAVEELGICAALVPESAGGAGLGWSQAEPTLHALGFHAAPVPLAETMIAAAALAAAGIEIPAGPVVLSTAAWTSGTKGTVSGSDECVPWLAPGTPVVLAANGTALSKICLVEPTGSECSTVESVGRIPGSRLTLADAVPRAGSFAPIAWSASGLRAHLAIARVVMSAGALSKVLELAIDYANQRVQFGRTIGSFQAVQHLIAELAACTASVRVAGRFGCARADAGSTQHGAMIAKAYAGRSAARGAAIAHQVFAAIGVTDEHILHYYTRRLLQWRTEAGSDHYWSEALGQRFLQNGGATLWPAIADGVTADGDSHRA